MEPSTNVDGDTWRWGGQGARRRAASMEPSTNVDGDASAQPTTALTPSLQWSRRHHCYPDLNKLFVAKQLGLAVGADIVYRSSLPRENVLGIEHPGDPGYDRHHGLPST